MHLGQYVTLVLLLAGLLGVWLGNPGSANAHGGLTVLNEVEGPYRIVARVSWSGDLVDEEVAVLDVARKQLVSTATVTLELYDQSGATRGPYVGRVTNGVLDIRFPKPDTGAGWRVRVIITGPLGPVVVEHRFRTPAKEWAVGSGWAGFAGVMLFGVVLATLPFIAWRFGMGPTPESPSSEPQGSKS